jgi:membrane peptidoglycan carboxypeptidase
MANDSNRGSVKKPNRRKGALSVYSNLSGGRRTKVDARARQKAEFLATLPKSRLKRVAYRLNPRRLAKYWFSKEGGLMALKLAGLGLAAFIILILAVFAIFRKDLALGPDELTKRVQSRTTKFYDRTGQVLLYELYKDQQMTYVKSDQISNNMKYATIAIEDKDFYKHGGFDLRGIGRTVVNNVTGGGKQGASTITQQLVKNVILEDSTRSGLAGYTRKLKELILSIELERTYSKDEILNYYLNAIGYGGTAYGVESASKRYFAKSAKDLTIEESAYIASIPQYPSIYDKNSPSFDQEATIARQRTVIDYMRQQGYINSSQASDAKKVDILAKIVPLNNNVDIKAPHFVNEIIKELEGEYGANNVRKGGWRITTTLDWDLQQLAEQSVKDNMRAVERYNGNNAAMVAIDVKTNQVLAMVGSRDYNHPGYGSFNAATSSLQPGSSLKPFVYSTLFEGNSYGPGSVIADSPEKFFGISPNNFDKRFRGSISIRSSLAESRNLPAMKAANITGMKNVIDRAKTAGEKDITCGQAGECSDPFLAIGSGSVHLDQHTAAYASLARGGVSKPESNILKIEKATGEVVKEWKDTTGTKVFGEKGQEITYLISDILSDRNARTPTFGGSANQVGFNPNGVRIAVKTGTTDNAKDGWMMGYSPKLAVGVWVGRADGVAMGNNAVTHLQTGPMFGAFMEKAHKQVMNKPQYGWKSGDWFTQPRGIQRLTIGGKTDLFQSWFRKPRESNKTYTMDRVSKKLATACTPEGAKEQIQVTSTIDSTTNKEIEGTPPSGYDIKNNDDVHQCGDPQPSATVSNPTKNGSTYTVNATVSSGKFPIQTIDFLANGQILSSQPYNGSNNYTVSNVPPNTSIQVRVTDQGYYQQTSNTVTTGP